MSEILLGQSYYLRFDPKLWQQMQPYAPLGTLYAASYLRQHGFNVALFDAMLADSEQEWDQALEFQQPKFAILYEDNFNYLSKMCLLRMRQAAFTMIEMARKHGCTIILCGADASDHSAEYLAHGADFVLLGEGEQTMIELLEKLTGKTQIGFESILGLAYQFNNEYRHNPRRPDIHDLDKLPMPAWDLLDVQRYRSIWMERHGYFSMNMVTTRGCPFHCNWCAKPIWGQRYNTRSPENVASEMLWLKHNFQPDHIWFADDIFGLKPGWLVRFGDLLQAQGAQIPFKCLSRADLLTRPGEVAALKRAGAATLWMGAESGSQKILDAMDKGTRVEQIHEAAQRLKAAGIRVGFFLQFGYPGETRADIEKTIQLVRDCSPDDIGISVSYPMPGTKFFTSVRAQLGEKQNWQDSDDLEMLYQGPYPTSFYRKLHTVIHKEFRARAAWRALKSRLSLRLLGRLIYNLLSLPLAKWQLAQLASTQPAVNVLALPHLPPELAAQPSPQAESSPAASPEQADQSQPPEIATIARAFSLTAEKYDAFADDHPHLERLRAKVHAHLQRQLPPGARILELNAGSGVDAIHLAKQGFHVHATDIASGMLARLQAKIIKSGLEQQISTQECSFTDLEQVQEGPFDAIFSDMGGLNCISVPEAGQADLSPVIRKIPQVLKPGGLVTWVLMPPVCLWEMAEILRGHKQLAFRRFAPNGTRSHLEGYHFDVHYFSPQQVLAWFGQDYQVVSLEGLSVITPTAESKNFSRRFPRIYASLAWLDDRLSTRAPWWGWGDFYILSLRYQPKQG